jgi:hypothetical protein
MKVIEDPEELLLPLIPLYRKVFIAKATAQNLSIGFAHASSLPFIHKPAPTAN